nr:copper homeostasis membrane protein CopD [Aquitalea sp. LB_tupeE]
MLWLCRWLTDGAAMWLWGSSLFVLALLPAALRQDFWQQQASWNRHAARVLLLATLSALPLHSAILGDGWADSWQAASLLTVVSDSGIGHAWCWQMVAALALWLVTKGAGSRHSLPVTAGLSAALLASLSLSGHAAMQQGWQGLAHRGNDWLHLLSCAAWLGALPLVLQLLRQPAPALQPALPGILRRFSTTGHAVVFLVFATGLINWYLINGSLLPDSLSAYATLLGVKLLLVAGMTVLALYNRYHLVPRMPQGLPCLRRAVCLQIACCLLALTLLAVLGTLDPHQTSWLG